jgi:cytochrome c oxidase subunit II
MPRTCLDRRGTAVASLAAGTGDQPRRTFGERISIVTPLRNAFLAVCALLGAPAAFLPGVAGAAQPRPWEIGMQPAATPVMHELESFHNILLVVISLIVLLVLGLLLYVIMNFGERRNPSPSPRTHNALIEVIWTTAPVIILVLIAIPSFKLLYAEDVIPKADLTVKAVGHQWYWSYEYPDNGGFGFDSTMVQDSDLKPGQPRLLTVDNRVIVPVGKTVRVVTTSSDVIHSWAVPSFGVKMDAVPGRLNETWFKVERVGTYYGQCSELCGVNHGFMPIEVEAVTQADFDAWVAAAKKKFADAAPAAPAALTRVALGAAPVKAR